MSNISSSRIIQNLLDQIDALKAENAALSGANLDGILLGMHNPVTVSASGKVLITGGYLVLERPNAGLVLAGSARFYSTLSWQAAAVSPDTSLQISVRSPQFGVEWSYRLKQESGVLYLQSSDPAQSSNLYVESTLIYTMAAVLATVDQTLEEVVGAAGGANSSLHVLLNADNDFYSQQTHLRKRGLVANRHNLASLPKHLPCPTDENGKAEVAKTGMGSSAALITSLVGALLVLFNRTDLSQPKGKELAFKVAQICHAVAQGKVGSGFDVSAAVWGSHQYTRFSKTALQPVLSSDAPLSDGVSPSFVAPMINVARGGGSSSSSGTAWDHCVQGFQLPPMFELLMGDICGGSETPSMVRKVLKWKGDVEGEALWDSINEVCMLYHTTIEVCMLYHTTIEVCMLYHTTIDVCMLYPIEGVIVVRTTITPLLLLHYYYSTTITPLLLLPCTINKRAVRALWLSRSLALSLSIALTHSLTHSLTLSHTLSHSLSSQVNGCIAVEFAALCAVHQSVPSEYTAEIERCSQLPADQWGSSTAASTSVNEVLRRLQTAFARVRSLLREMGERADVPIEPAPQQALCDATIELPGVIACGVPGAGGYDAVFVIALNASALANVEKLWLGRGQGGKGGGEVCPLLLQAEGCGGGNGIRVEH
jgi:ERG8-type phosphomevalonate kinase